MTKAVFTTKVEPTYDDLPEERYHFPNTYLRQVEAAVGDWQGRVRPRRPTDFRGRVRCDPACWLFLRLCLLHRQAGAVIVENHLNMVRLLNGAPKVSPSALAAVLNSPIVDRVFRCISGSVAVSAFELEALPLPTVRQMAAIERLVGAGASREAVNAALLVYYGGEAK